MDPNETLKQIDQHIQAGDEQEAAECYRDLAEWMSKGGFNPIWSNYPQAAAYYGKLSKSGV